MRLLKLYLLVIFIFIVSEIVFSQPAQLLFENSYYQRFDKAFYNAGTDFHPQVKPYYLNQLNQVSGYDSLFCSYFYPKSLSQDTDTSNLVSLLVTPVLNAQIGNENWQELSVGINASLTYNKLLAGAIQYNYGNSLFPQFLDTFIQQKNVVPGQGYAFLKNGRYTYQNTSAYLAYQPSKYFLFEIGNGKHFIGDGYRSMMLSDNANNYPYFKLNTNVWKLQYTNLFMQLNDVRFSNGNRADYKKKYAAIHYLSWNLTKRLNLGFFESIVFETRDSTAAFYFDVNYLNPLIFYRPVEYSIGSGDNALMGANVRYRLFNSVILYGQAVIDEFLLKEIRARSGWWANKYALQIGMKWLDMFTIKNLSFQSEYNFVRPFTYTHSSVLQNYGHFNQPLAHPHGANFEEYIMILRYYYKRLGFELKSVQTFYGDDEATIYFGRDIYRSYLNRPADYGNYTGQGIATYLNCVDFKVDYLIVPNMRLSLFAAYSNRKLRNIYYNQNTHFIMGGIRTSIGNKYYDF